jgi:hypothetical protein
MVVFTLHRTQLCSPEPKVDRASTPLPPGAAGSWPIPNSCAVQWGEMHPLASQRASGGRWQGMPHGLAANLFGSLGDLVLPVAMLLCRLSSPEWTILLMRSNTEGAG